MKFRKGRKIAYKTLNVSPKYALPAVAKKKRTAFQNRPTILPSAIMPSFLASVPFNSKVMQIKRKLKNKRMTAASVLTKLNAAATHSAIAVKKSTESKCLATVFFQFTLSFPLSH